MLILSFDRLTGPVECLYTLFSHSHQRGNEPYSLLPPQLVTMAINPLSPADAQDTTDTTSKGVSTESRHIPSRYFVPSPNSFFPVDRSPPDRRCDHEPWSRYTEYPYYKCQWRPRSEPGWQESRGSHCTTDQPCLVLKVICFNCKGFTS